MSDIVNTDDSVSTDDNVDTYDNWDEVRSELEQRFGGSRGQSDVMAEIAAINSRAAQQIFFGGLSSFSERDLSPVRGTRALGEGASLLVEVGPCDDTGQLFINGFMAVNVGLGEIRRFQRNLPDGDYNFRFVVGNRGGWAWAAKLRLVVNGAALADVDEVGGSGFFTGQVYEGEWQCRIVGGEVREF
jgi:hypothetical protein